jgi:hypothetical protein
MGTKDCSRSLQAGFNRCSGLCSFMSRKKSVVCRTVVLSDAAMNPRDRSCIVTITAVLRDIPLGIVITAVLRDTLSAPSLLTQELVYSNRTAGSPPVQWRAATLRSNHNTSCFQNP